MTCEYEGPNGEPCQFQVEGEPLRYGQSLIRRIGTFNFDDKEWCPFHLPDWNDAMLPLVDAEGSRSRKATEPKIFVDNFRATFKEHGQKTPANLMGVVFPQGFSCHEINISDRTCFSHTRFGEGTKFGNKHLGPNVTFDGSIFGKNIDFRDTIFSDGVKFDRCIFGANARFDSGVGMGAVSFSDAEFLGYVLFADRNFSGAVDFSNATFHGIPDFHGAEHHQGTNFHNAQFKFALGKDDEETYRGEQAYRTLKLAMANISVTNEQADFFAYEMECRRRRGTATRSERFLATLYKLRSDYGRDLARPLLWFAFLFMFAVGLATIPPSCLVLAGMPVGCFENADPVAALGYVMDQSVRPFSGLLTSFEMQGGVVKLKSAHPFVFVLFSLLYSLGVIGLTTLFILAIRRRFRMG